jgi:hypothetical protein
LKFKLHSQNGNPSKINLGKVACFSSLKTDRQLTSFHQQSTTNSPSKNHVLHPIFAKTPSKNEVNHTPKKITADSSGGGRVGQADADAVDAAVGAGQDFEAEAFLFDDFAGEWDVAGDLGDKAAEGGGFVVLG